MSKKYIPYVVLVLGVFVIVSVYFVLTPRKQVSVDREVTPQVQNIVTPEPFADENDFTEKYTAQVDRVAATFEHKNYTEYRLTTNGLVREGMLNTERGYKDDIDATVYVLDWQKPDGEQMYFVRLTNEPTQLYALDSARELIKGSALTLE